MRAFALRVVGALSLALIALTVWLGLFVTPPDQFMGNLVRLLYIHPAVAWVAYLAFGVSFLASLLYLWPRTRSLAFDRLAGASAEVGVVFTGVTLVTGSIWGRPTWGVWWASGSPSSPRRRSSSCSTSATWRCAAFPGSRHRGHAGRRDGAIVAFVDVPIAYFSVYLWRSLHQQPSVEVGRTFVHGSMAWTMLLGFVAFTLAFVWLLAKRYRLATLQGMEDEVGLDLALAERQAEGVL